MDKLDLQKVEKLIPLIENQENSELLKAILDLIQENRTALNNLIENGQVVIEDDLSDISSELIEYCETKILDSGPEFSTVFDSILELDNKENGSIFENMRKVLADSYQLEEEISFAMPAEYLKMWQDQRVKFEEGYETYFSVFNLLKLNKGLNINANDIDQELMEIVLREYLNLQNFYLELIECFIWPYIQFLQLTAEALAVEIPEAKNIIPNYDIFAAIDVDNSALNNVLRSLEHLGFTYTHIPLYERTVEYFSNLFSSGSGYHYSYSMLDFKDLAPGLSRPDNLEGGSVARVSSPFITDSPNNYWYLDADNRRRLFHIRGVRG